MIFIEKAKPGPFTLQLYEMLLREAPVDYLEATEAYWLEDLYFIANADLSAELFDDRCYLKFHYTAQ
jgi:hypothetical protein